MSARTSLRMPPDYEPGPKDVCLGRSEQERNRASNVAFHTFLIRAKAKAYYRETPNKSAAVKLIVEDMRCQGWRFLKQERDEHDNKCWCEIGDTKARSKVKRGLADLWQYQAPPPKALPASPPAQSKVIRMPTFSNSEEDASEAGMDRALAATNNVSPPSPPSTREATRMPSAMAHHRQPVFSIPDGLLPRCARQFGWTPEFCQRILTAYRQFMELKRQHEDWNATVLSPPVLVDKMWHEHILDVQHYVQACHNYCGNNLIVGHNPDGALDPAAQAFRIQTTKISVRARFDKQVIDSKIWSVFGDGARIVANSNVHHNKRPREHVDQDQEHLVVRIRDQVGDETVFRVKRSTKMELIFEKYANRKGVSSSSLAFLLDGDRISPELTPAMLELEEEDQIDCMLQQCGC